MEHHGLLFGALGTASIIFFVIVGIVLAFIVLMAITGIFDKLQHRDAIRHNYPFIGHFRYWFMHLGVFFRAYFFAEDREEMPFNRVEREWVYSAAQNKSTTAAFGSTRATPPGTISFANGAFAPLETDHVKPSEITFGPQTKNPYTTTSFFHVSAMSFGALSAPAVLALSHGAKMAGVMMDTGEGGISPYHLEGGADLVAELGTAKYGYRTADGKLDDDKLRDAAKKPQVKMFSIKLGQGAKPGKGGLLPGVKITKEIAEIRGIPEGHDSDSPNRWPEISNVEELLDMIDHIRSLTAKPTGFKFVMGNDKFMHDLCDAINKRGADSAPDFIIVDSANGGTAAAPQSLMDFVGMNIRESLPIVVDTLIKHGLRERIKVGVSGKLINPGAVAWALCMGADYINSARGFMLSLGCIQAMRCHLDTCPTGVTTQKKHLQSGLDPRVKKVRVMNYAKNILEQVGVIAHSCGVEDPRELKREHVRIMEANDISVGADEVWPYPEKENA
jgi:glutamate synthase domain-containing protein 2